MLKDNLEAIQIFPYGSPKEAVLRYLANLLNVAATHIEYRVELALFDAVQNWFWTTIIAHNRASGHTWQFMTPAEQWDILFGGDEDYQRQVRLLCARAGMQNAVAEEAANAAS